MRDIGNSENCVIRKAMPEDAEALHHLATLAFACYLPRMDRPPAPMLVNHSAHIDNEETWILEVNGKPVGYVILLQKTPEIALLDTIAVDPAFQHLGYGRHLLNFAEAEARKTGSKQLNLYTNAVMRENLEWYPKRGYRESHRAIQNGYDRVFFEKDLTGTW